MREAYTLGLRGDDRAQHERLRHRAIALASAIVNAASADFISRTDQAEPVGTEADLARQSAQLLDRACGELHGSVSSQTGGDRSPDLPLTGLATFLEEALPILMHIADAGTPHTVYRLLELLEHLLPLDPGKVFDIAMHAALGGGRRSGFQFESMGADRLVGLVGRLLADHRQVFESEERRGLLVQCLELFAGWPAAARLLYRLPELFR